MLSETAFCKYIKERRAWERLADSLNLTVLTLNTPPAYCAKLGIDLFFLESNLNHQRIVILPENSWTSKISEELISLGMGYSEVSIILDETQSEEELSYIREMLADWSFPS